MYKYVLVHFYMTGMSQYELGCTSMYWYILAYFVNSGFSHTALSASGYEAVQGGTRQYQKVPYPWIWRYKALYLHLLPCTSISRGTGLSGTALYLIVPISLPCTALYRLVSRRGQEDTRQYDSVPEWTSWHVPVCIRIFQQGEICVVHAGMY